jgi:hypothetical protein
MEPLPSNLHELANRDALLGFLMSGLSRDDVRAMLDRYRDKRGFLERWLPRMEPLFDPAGPRFPTITPGVDTDMQDALGLYIVCVPEFGKVRSPHESYTSAQWRLCALACMLAMGPDWPATECSLEVSTLCMAVERLGTAALLPAIQFVAWHLSVSKRTPMPHDYYVALAYLTGLLFAAIIPPLRGVIERRATVSMLIWETVKERDPTLLFTQYQDQQDVWRVMWPRVFEGTSGILKPLADIGYWIEHWVPPEPDGCSTSERLDRIDWTPDHPAEP